MKRKRNVIKVFGLILILVLILVLSSGCIGKSEQEKKAEKVKEEALAYIEELYGEEFVIKNVRYISATGVWELTAAPKDDESLGFFVRTGGTFGDEILSDYGNTKLTHQSRKYYKPVLEDIFGRELYFFSNTGTYAKFKNNKIPTFEELLEYGSEETFVIFVIYMFEDVITKKEKKEEFLANVMELLEYLRGQNLKWATIHIKIYDEEFFRDKDIDHILEVSDWFHRGTNEFDVWEYKSYEIYALRIDDKEFFEIKTIKELDEELYKINKKILRE